MKKALTTLALAIVLFIVFVALNAKAKPVIVKNPTFEGAATQIIEITQVELTKNATVLDIRVRFTPHYWISFSKETVLEADGKKYALTGAKGIEPDSLFWMPDSGEADFQLIFSPLPLNTKRFSLIEGEGERSFNIWGVCLTEEADNGFPEGLPVSLKKEPKDGPLPAPVFESGKTTLHVHLLGDKHARIGNHRILTYDIFHEQKEFELSFDDNGVATAEFEQRATVMAYIVLGDVCYIDLWLAPGEEIDVYIDGRINGFMASHNMAKNLSSSGMLALQNIDARKPNPNGYVYTTGRYADLNRMANRYFLDDSLPLDTEIFSYRMTGDEYTDEMISQYKACASFINEKPWPQMFKELQIATLQQNILSEFINYHRLLVSYDEATGEMKRLPLDSLNIKLSAENVQKFASLFDIDNPSHLMGSSLLNYLDVCIYDYLFEKKAGGQMNVIGVALDKMKDAENGELELTEELAESLKSELGAFYIKELQKINDEALKAKNNSLSLTQPTPDNPLENLFESIIAPHKGKVVIVDFWNTWCAPCREALKENEPLKTTELASDDIVWIYIANETSPIGTYAKQISEIRGLHYRLNDEQWRQLTKKDFPQIDGIPAYVFVPRDGKPQLRLDFRDHELMKSEIKKELGKVSK